MKEKATATSFGKGKLVYIILFVVGAVAFLYPLVTSMINMQTQTRVIADYQQEIDRLAEYERLALMTEAQNYNDFVKDLEGNVTDDITDAERLRSDTIYMNVLVVGDTIGYVKIPKIDVELPIFRGTSDEVLDAGIGHLERSSLPIGGENTHSVLTGHRGLPTSRLFRDLNLLEKEDIFLINSLNGTLAYKVETAITVLPHEVEMLQIQEGRDLCTLITCDPYMINSHRLLVMGERTDYTPEMEQAPPDRISFLQKYWEYFVIISIFAALWIAVWLVRMWCKRKHQNVQGGAHE